MVTATTTVTRQERNQVDKANASGRQPVVFVHGLWLLPTSWNRWAKLFDRAGYFSLTPGWPDDPDTVEHAKEHPEVFANKSISQVADHFEEVIRGLSKKPAVIGHSFGGLMTKILAGRGLSAASVAISPAPFRGVLPLPISALRSGSPVLRNPRNRHRAVPLTYDQFRYAFANAVDEDEAHRLYEGIRGPRARRAPVPSRSRQPQPVDRGQGRHEESRARPHVAHLGRGGPHGPLGGLQRVVQAREAQRRRHRDREGPERGHALTIDNGWREVADVALQFIKRFV